MGKLEENKLQKKNRLMDTAFSLYTTKGIVRTTISDIVEKAGIAKGTFYLYFRDKYDLEEKLIVRKSDELFRHALEYSGYAGKTAPEEKLIALIDDILLQLKNDPHLMRFISKNLSWGVFRRAIIHSEVDYAAVFESIFETQPTDRKTLEIKVYTVLELVGSTCHTVILDSDPVDMDTYLPYLHRAILAILRSFREDPPVRPVSA